MHEQQRKVDAPEVIATVRDFLVESGHVDGDDVAADESLFASGAVSSLALVEVIDLIEETWGVAVPPRDATLENLDTLESVARFVVAHAHR